MLWDLGPQFFAKWGEWPPQDLEVRVPCVSMEATSPGTAHRWSSKNQSVLVVTQFQLGRGKSDGTDGVTSVWERGGPAALLNKAVIHGPAHRKEPEEQGRARSSDPELKCRSLGNSLPVREALVVVVALTCGSTLVGGLLCSPS